MQGRPPDLRERRRATMRVLVLTPVLRWTPNRKVQLCIALKHGIISPEEAIAAHKLDADEVSRWRDDFEREGTAAFYLRHRHRRKLAS